MTRWLFLAVVVLALAVNFPILAQDDAHIGTWKQNFDKSTSSQAPTGPRPQSVVRTYERFEGKGIKATFVTVTADGKTVTTSYTAHFDGKEYPYTGGNLATIALKRTDAYSWTAINKGRGKNGNTGTNVVSKDGKTLTYTSKGTNAEGQPVSAVLVFEKQ